MDVGAALLRTAALNPVPLIVAVVMFLVIVGMSVGAAWFHSPPPPEPKRRRRRRASDAERPAWLRAPDDTSSDPPLPAGVDACLRRHSVTTARGFLPERDPLPRSAMPGMDGLETVLEGLTASLRRGDVNKLRDAIDGAAEAAFAELGPEPAWPDDRELRRSLLVLTVLTNAFVWCGGSRQVARQLSAPLAALVEAAARAVGTEPILTHASAALYNWRRADASSEDLSAENLRLLNGFLGSDDEAHFFLLTTEVEWRGAPLPGQLLAASGDADALLAALSGPGDGAAEALGLRAQDAARAMGASVVTQLSGDERGAPRPLAAAPADERAAAAALALTARLRAVARAIVRMTSSMGRMSAGCRPDAFYNEVRPFLAGWRANPVLPDGLVYGGGAPRQCYGGSAAQSSLVQAADAGLGVDHAETGGRAGFLRAMREGYMPTAHRDLLVLMAGSTPARAAVAAAEAAAPDACDRPTTVAGALCGAFDECIRALTEFRSSHMAIVGEFILGPQARLARAGDLAATAGGKGTGGTDLMTFLRPLRDETRTAGL